MRVIQLTGTTLHGVLFEAVKAVRAGEVLVYPTDTVYGIGGDALNPRVVERIFQIKARPRERALVVLVQNIAMARRYAYIDLWTESILERLWPGPVSVVLQRKENMPETVASGGETVALRVPDSPFLQELLRQVACPLVATSANLSGKGPEPRTLDAFLAAIRGGEAKPDLVIDAGELGDTPSTILDLTDRKNPKILRRGALSDEDLQKLLRTDHEKTA